MLKMSSRKYEAMLLPSLLLLLLMLILGSCQATTAPHTLLSSPRQLVVRTEPSRAAIVVGRKVARPPERTSTTTAPAVTPEANATTSTTVPTTTKDGDNGNGNEVMTGLIEVALAELVELDNNTALVGGQAHTFGKFKQINLGAPSTLAQPTHENSLPQTNGVRGTCQESRVKLTSAGPEQRNASVTIKMCAIESNGTAVRGDESMPLTEGQFLLSVIVEDWSWCGCDDKQGQYLEFTLNLKVPENRAISKDEASNMPVKYKLGTDDSYMMVSTKYGFGDSTWKSMPEGFPELMLPMDVAAIEAMVKVRVPRETSASYSLMTLIIEPGYKSAGEGPGPVGAAPRVVPGTQALAIVTTAFFFMLAALFSNH